MILGPCLLLPAVIRPSPAVPPQATAHTLRWGGNTLRVATGTFLGQRSRDGDSSDTVRPTPLTWMVQPTQLLCSWDLPAVPARKSISQEQHYIKP